MDFELNEDQRAVEAASRRSAADKLAPHEARWDEEASNVAAALNRRDPRATILCAMARRFAGDVGFELANGALQLHGGYGYLKDFRAEQHVRDLRVHQILEGTNEIMRVIIERDMLRH